MYFFTVFNRRGQTPWQRIQLSRPQVKPRWIRRPQTAASLSLLLSILTVFASMAEPVDTNSSATTDNEVIVVTATRSPYYIGEVANQVHVIDAKTIAGSGAQNVAELLRHYGSVQVRDSQGNGRDTRLTLRGYSAAANALILVDGRKLNNSDLGGQDLTAVAMSDIAHIEILNGGAGALFGDQAIGGVVNIITHRRGDAGGSLMVGRGSYDNETYSANYHGDHASGWYYRINSALERGDGYRDEARVNYESYSVVGGFAYDAGDVSVEARQSDNEYLLTGALSVADVVADRRQAGTSFNDYVSDNRTARLSINHQINEATRLIAAYSDPDEDIVIDASSSFGNTTTLQSRRVKTFDPRFVIELDKWRLTFGADIERVEYDFAIDFGFGPSGSAHENRKSAQYLQVLYRLTDTLSLQGGLRHARLKTEVSPFDIDYRQQATAHQAGLVWQDARWRLYLNRDETFRFPLADETVDFFGNVARLDLQRGVAWELGIERRGLHLDSALSLFQQDNRDEIGFDPALGFFGANTNFDDSRRRGATLSLDWPGAGRWSGGLIYTYLDAEFVDGAYDDNRLPGVARELAKGHISISVSPRSRITGEMLYTGPQALDLANSGGGLGGYTVANLVGTYTWGDWQLTARLNNITAKEYVEFATFFGTRALYPSPERNLMVSLAYRLE